MKGWLRMLLPLALAGLFVIWYVQAGRLLDAAPRVEEVIGRTWSLHSIDGVEVTPSPQLIFSDIDTVDVITECRTLTGGWGFDASGLAFAAGGFESDVAPCDGPAGDAERAATAALERSDSWATRDDGCAIEIDGTTETPVTIMLARDCSA